MKLKADTVKPSRIEQRLVHGQLVDVKIYPVGATNIEEDDELEELIRLLEPEAPTVRTTGREFRKNED